MQGAATFGTYDGLRDVASQLAYKDPEDFSILEVVSATGKGSAKGAIASVVGGMIGNATNKASNAVNKAVESATTRPIVGAVGSEGTTRAIIGYESKAFGNVIRPAVGYTTKIATGAVNLSSEAAVFSSICGSGESF